MKSAQISIYDRENNAVRLLSAMARNAGHSALEIYFKDWINNGFIPPNPAEIANLIKLLKQHEIQIVGLSLRASPYFKVASQLTAVIQQELQIPVLWGGTHAILCPEECIQAADLVCVGEGEKTWPQLLDKMEKQEDYTGLANLWVKKGSEIYRNPVADLIEDLDTLPFRDYTHPDKYYISGSKIIQGDPMSGEPIFQMLCSRGCPFSCSFCYNSVFKSDIYKDKGRYYRLRSVDSVLAELKKAKAAFPHLVRIKFDDEVFPFEEKWFEEFCQRYPQEIGLPFECFTESKLVEESRFSKLKQAGLKIIYMGVQSTSKICHELYNRETPERQILEAANTFHRLKLDARYQVIVDDPLSGEAEYESLFDFLMLFPRPFALYLFSLTVYPRTALAQKLLELNIINPEQIEGRATKTFRQLRVDLNYPRTPPQLFWTSMLVLMTKNFLPKSFLRKLSKNQFLKQHPKLPAAFAQFCNFIHMGYLAGKMLLSGEMSFSTMLRWLNLRSWITQ